MATITLTNSFHNTEANVRPVLITEGRFAGKYKISKATAKRLQRTLCGVSGCTCGGEFGQREAMKIDIVNQDYDNNYIVELIG